MYIKIVMANDEVLKKKPLSSNFYKEVYFINYQSNLVPRVSYLPQGRKIRDPGNCSPMKKKSGLKGIRPEFFSVFTFTAA